MLDLSISTVITFISFVPHHRKASMYQMIEQRHRMSLVETFVGSTGDLVVKRSKLQGNMTVGA